MRLFVATFIVFTIFALSPDVQAVPTFTWIEPWNVTLLPVTTQNGTPLGRQAFGSAAMQSEQILDTNSDTAVAKAATQTRTGDAGVAFSREFELSGSPHGWNVSLTGVLNGTLLALGSGIGASASVLATADISPFLGLDLSRRVGFPTGDSRSELSLSQTQTAFLSDGIYTVTGLLRTVSGALGGVALSDFFGGVTTNPQPGFQVSVSAGAVPEPSTVLLLVTGLVGVAWTYRKKSRIGPPRARSLHV